MNRRGFRFVSVDLNGVGIAGRKCFNLRDMHVTGMRQCLRRRARGKSEREQTGNDERAAKHQQFKPSFESNWCRRSYRVPERRPNMVSAQGCRIAACDIRPK